jgi:hypothetical protein
MQRKSPSKELPWLRYDTLGQAQKTGMPNETKQALAKPALKLTFA